MLWVHVGGACTSGDSGQRHLVSVITTSVRPVLLSFGSSSIWIFHARDSGISLSMLGLNNYISPHLFLVRLFCNILHGHAFRMHESHVFVTHTLMLHNPKMF